MKQWLDAFWQLLFPWHYCVLCGKTSLEGPICANCTEERVTSKWQLCRYCATFIERPATVCRHCAERPLPGITKAVALAPYEEPLRHYLHQLKYEGKRYLAHPLGEALAFCVQQSWPVLPFTCITAVPATAKRQKERGYNQAMLLATVLAEELNLPLWDDLLCKVKETPSQTQLTRQQRFENVRDAYGPGEGIAKISGTSVLLVDDIFTTGATLSSCSRILLQNGCRNVFISTVAGGKSDGLTDFA